MEEKSEPLIESGSGDGEARSEDNRRFFGLDGRRCYLALLVFMVLWSVRAALVTYGTECRGPAAVEHRAANILKKNPLIG
jgi:hypothetical protein